MEEVRYLLSIVARMLRKQWRQPASRRRAITLALAFLWGVLLWLLSRRWLPPALRDTLWLLALALLSVWAAWFGIRHGKRFWEVYRWAKQLRHHEESDLVLSYDAELEPLREEFLQKARLALREAEQFLQTPLEDRQRAVVILQDSSMERLNRLWDNRFSYGGWAHTLAESVFVVYYGDIEQAYRTLLHEWTHLITARWNEDAPALFKEGAAVATQYHDEPLQAHARALYYLNYFHKCSLLYFVDSERFYDPDWKHATYAWAGSFTLYLLERFGLPRFRRFFHRLATQSPDEAFQAEFEMSLGQAELLWRDYLHSELPEETRRDALRRALNDTLFWATRNESTLAVQLLSERMLEEQPDCWMGYYGLGVCAFWRGDLEGVQEWFEQANRAPEQEETAFRGRAWFECGIVNDLQGRRERAKECYQRALEYPDEDEPAYAYHARARRYLETPYTCEERFRFLSG